MSNSLIERVSRERNCTPELVRAIVNDVLAGFHEVAVKEGMTPAIIEAYWALGPLGSWHLGGLLMDAAADEPRFWAEHYARLDPKMKRFLHIKEQWEEEVRQRNEG